MEVAGAPGSKTVSLGTQYARPTYGKLPLRRHSLHHQRPGHRASRLPLHALPESIGRGWQRQRGGPGRVIQHHTGRAEALCRDCRERPHAVSLFLCGDCGSPIYSHRATTPETLVVRAGTLDDSSAMKITMNIWTRSARPWAWIDPASKQHPGQPDAPTTGASFSSPPKRSR